MRLSTKYGEKTIEFEVSYRNRRTLAIQVEPLEKILVISPVGLSEDYLKEKVRSKGKWIVNKLLEFKDMGYIPFKKEFVNGEAFLYSGRNYSLHILLNSNIIRPKVELSDSKILITSPSKDQEILKTALQKWYKKEASKLVMKRVDFYKPKFKAAPKEIKVKEQKRRWGSCTSKGNIYFNWRIIMAPSPVLDYIVVHEMSHLIQRNHSPGFWKLVEFIIPDYKDRKKWLRNYGVRMDL